MAGCPQRVGPFGLVIHARMLPGGRLTAELAGIARLELHVLLPGRSNIFKTHLYGTGIADSRATRYRAGAAAPARHSA